MKTVRTILTGLASFVIGGLLQISPALAAHPPAAAGDNFFGGRLEVTFIKWLTDKAAAPPGVLDMEGVVSGDVGGGKFKGEVLGSSQSGDILTLHALYHIPGGAFSFTADNTVTQDNSKGTAVINGTVISEGPLKGARVQGEYQVISPCGILNANNAFFPDVCFQGTLVVRPGSGQ
jgi:hypothetical protein